MPAGHSEGNEDDGSNRCVNTGYGVDIGYDYQPFKYNLHKYLGVSLRLGGLVTYTNYETALRESVGSTESAQARESSVTLLAVAKPTLDIGAFKPYLFLGAGPDYMQSRGVGFGYLIKAFGADMEVTDNLSFGVSRREYMRTDKSFYRYYTATLNYSF